MPARPAAASDPTVRYRLRLRELHDFAGQWAALGRPYRPGPAGLVGVEYDPPGLVGIEFELWAQPPRRWRMRRIKDVPGNAVERDDRFVDGDRWYWAQPEDAVEYGDATDGAPPTFRHLFQPETLLTHCAVTAAGSGQHIGRPADIAIARPRPDVPPNRLGHWGQGAEEYEMHIDRATGIVLRSAARHHGAIFHLDEVIDMEVNPDLPAGVFSPPFGPLDVLHRRGETGPGILTTPSRARRRAQQHGFDLLLPQPLPPGAVLRVWHRPPIEPSRRYEMLVQVDLPSGRNVVLFQHAAHPGSPMLVNRTCVEVTGTADAEEVQEIIRRLTPPGPPVTS
ncbi:hypothetical protein ACTMS0_18405 [Micromonospora sp. H33]|uniref:hypothetical protein n=1 Tax=Micromonospora sp. H33 TaxID=3452215 RepID=UPI003F886E79